MNLSELLERSARQWPDKPALIEDFTTVSYAGLLEQIGDLASRIQALKIPPGCRIGLRFPNSINYVALTFALWRVQAVVVPMPMECTGEELDAIAAALQLEAIFSCDSSGSSEQIAANCFLSRLTPPSEPNNHRLNIAFIRFTSGTTNARKGVVLCHETIRDRILAANQALKIGPADTVIWCLPMAHHFLITIVLYLSQGATIVLTRQVLARAFLETVNQHEGTVLYAAPFHYALLAKDDSKLTLPNVRLAVSTTCALPQDVAEDFFERFRIRLAQGLGIIELGLVSLNGLDTAKRWNSVGKPLPGYEVRILHPDENGCGEVAISGPGMLDAYAAPWLSREQVAPDGWFITGDIGRLDSEGFLFLAGRKTAVINLAGRKVFPEEIEAVLNRHPAVRESRVYGRHHPHLGEVVEAEVVLTRRDADPDSVRDYCREHLAAFKIPSRIQVVNTVPRTSANGKIRRTAALAQHD
jgi:long-chain acyl-CoA synthetase